MKNKNWFWWIGILLVILAACSSQSTPQTNEIETPVSGQGEAEDSSALQPVATPTEDNAAELPTTKLTNEEPDSTIEAENKISVEIEQSKGEALDDIGDAVIVFHRSGGFAGVDEQWLIYADGRIEGPEGVQRQVEPEQVQALLETITTNEFFALDDSYVPLDSCCDRFSYELTVRLDNNQKTIHTIDDAPEQPQQLTQILSAVDALLFASK